MHRLGFGPVLRQVDEVHQFAQTALVTAIEGKGQACQVAEVTFFMFRATVGLLVVPTAEAKICKAFFNVMQGRLAQGWCIRMTNWFFSQRLEW